MAMCATDVHAIGGALRAQYFALQLLTAYLGCVSTTGFYYNFGITTAANHLMGHLFLLAVLAFLKRFVWPKDGGPPAASDTGSSQSTYSSDLLVIAVCKVAVSVFQETIHRQTKEGGLYALRSFDFATTLVTLMVLRAQSAHYGHVKGDRNGLVLTVLISLFASAAWLEPGIYYLENVLYGLLAVPCLAFAQALEILHTHRLIRQAVAAAAAADGSSKSVEHYIYDVAKCVSWALLLPAALCVSDTLEPVLFVHLPQWGALDVFLFVWGLCNLAMYTYSKYWLVCAVEPSTYLVLRHFKYTLGSLGQWYAYDMKYATWYSALAKVAALALMAVYVWRRNRPVKCD